MSSQLFDKFKQLDAYAKTLEDFRVKTATGAAITVAGAIVMILLFLSEITTYMSPNISEELFVDTSRGHKLRINVDIIVPTISCDYLVLDAMDSSGEQHLQMDHNIHKRRLDLTGNPIEEPKKHEIATSTNAVICVASGTVGSLEPDIQSKKLNRRCLIEDLCLSLTCSESTNQCPYRWNNSKFPPYKKGKCLSTMFDAAKQNISDVAIVTCGSCFGAALNESQCCNTCEDVKEAYRLRKWALPDLATIEQCKNDDSIERTNMALKEGCQIYGYMEVNRVGGSFHIAPGKSFTINHVHVHDVQPYSSSVFNTTHIIKHLSFGTDIKSANTAPLDGVIGLAKEGAVMFQYYLKIVPTVYVNLDKSILHTNQFSVTRHQKSISTIHAESGMPGAFFSYELSPLMVKYTEKDRSIGHLATNICAIIGGVFTVAGILDACLYHSLNAFQNKVLLGKTG